MQDVQELISKEGVDQPFTAVDENSDGLLSLSTFDDTVYETRDASGWVCQDSGAPPAPARVAMPAKGTFQYEDCVVLNSNQQLNTYLVKLASASDDTGLAASELDLAFVNSQVFIDTVGVTLTTLRLLLIVRLCQREPKLCLQI